MSREINIKCFFYDGNDYSTGQMIDVETAYKENYIEFVGNTLKPTDECTIIIFFTGLYDKHNNPIYEGDIVSYNYIIGVIVFKDGAFGIEVKSDFYTKNNTSDIEIIGNKFENPELLKQ